VADSLDAKRSRAKKALRNKQRYSDTPTYKEFVRKKKKSRKKKNSPKETRQFTLHSSSAFHFDTFPTTGRMILRFAA